MACRAKEGRRTLKKIVFQNRKIKKNFEKIVKWEVVKNWIGEKFNNVEKREDDLN